MSETVVETYFRANSRNSTDGNFDMFLASMKILVKLIHNAQQPTKDTHRSIRLGNPTIQQAVIETSGAMDILLQAGFTKMELDGESFLIYYDNENDASKATAAEAILAELRARLAIIQPENSSTGASPKKKQVTPNPSSFSNTEETTSSTTKTTPPSKSSTSTLFLSDEERLRRQKVAQAKRKAQRAEKVAALRHWQEDQEERAERKERQHNAKWNNQSSSIEQDENEASFLANHIHIKRHRKSDQDANAHGQATKPAPSTTNDVNSNTPRQEEPTSKDFMKEYRAMHKQRLAQAAAKKPAPHIVDTMDISSKIDNMEEDGEDQKSSALPKDDMDMTCDSKMPAKTKPIPATMSHMDEDAQEDHEQKWKGYLEQIPSCMAVEGIKETSVYRNKKESSSRPSSLGKLVRELEALKESLPTDPRCSIWVRYDETQPQFIRALVTAALPGPSPYAGGMFCFDIYAPNDYPNVPPCVTLLTTGGGSVRFGPNLYADGKVCLSLLGTWPGPKWDPGVSTILQVLLSIQGLILGVEHPYYLEPGFGGWEGKVKTGQFASTGQTLSGATVTEDLNVPAELVAYESKITVGTMQFAMMEMMKAASSSSATPGLKHLHPFAHPVLAFFYHNRHAICQEVAEWESIADRELLHNENRGSYYSHTKNVCAELRIQLNSLSEPSFSNHDMSASSTAEILDGDLSTPSMEIEDSKPAVVAAVKEAGSQNETNNPVDCLRMRMQEAASAGEYVKAGKYQSALQKEESAIAELKKAMTDAASIGDFIRAGKLQEQLKSRIASIEDLANDIDNSDKPLADLMKRKKAPPPSHAMAAAMMHDELMPDDFDDENDSDGFSEEEMMTDGAFPPNMGMSSHVAESMGMPGFGMPKNWHPPAGSHNKYVNHNHSWGKGQTLAAKSTEPSVAATRSAIQTMDAPHKKPVNLRSGIVCILRLRLPDSQVLTEKFDAHDTVADVYRRIDPHLQNSAHVASSSNAFAAKSQRKQIMTPDGPRVVQAPAFSQPMSSRGYTLITNHPKREFSCEIHANKTLKEMQLVGSVSLTVLKCAERGVVKRGDLESRIAEAQGDAMDVEGLSYEALQELTERVGVSEQDWTDQTEEHLSKNSCLLSSADHLASLRDGNEEKQRCAICLGDFDPDDTQPNLRELTICKHNNNVFHEGCIRTWLATKSSCPICKADVLEAKTRNSTLEDDARR